MYAVRSELVSVRISLFCRDIVGIGLIHPVAFFTEVADAFFSRLFDDGVSFVPLAEALEDPAYSRAGSFVSDAFEVYQIKVAAADGRALDAVPPTRKPLIERVFELGAPLRPRRRGILVQNRRARPTPS